MLSASLKSYKEIFKYPPTLFPKEWAFENYKLALSFQPFLRQYWNSFYIAVLVTIGVLFFSSLAGYSFARLKFRGSNFFFILLLSALMMPSEVTIIPNFVYLDKLNLINTHFPLIMIPIFGSVGAMGTFIMRQAFLNLPKDLEEAAKIDGLGSFQIYLKIALPLVKSSLSTIAILTFLKSWNVYLDPLVYLNDTNKFTIPVALGNYVEPYGTPIWGTQLAATVMSVLPIMILFVLAQQQVVDSFATSGMKG
jgi:multiple sugar transport system permease protein